MKDPDLEVVKEFRKQKETKEMAVKLNQMRDKVLASLQSPKGRTGVDDDFHNSIGFWQAVLEEAGYETMPVMILRTLANGVMMGFLLAEELKRS